MSRRGKSQYQNTYPYGFIGFLIESHFKNSLERHQENLRKRYKH